MTGDDLELIESIPQLRRAMNGIPNGSRVRAHGRALELATAALWDLLQPGGARTSPLGRGWSTDIDLHLLSLPEAGRLRSLGWISLEPLFRKLGVAPGHRWAVVEGGEALACIDLHVDAPPDPVASLLARCRRRGEVRAREVLELRVLARLGNVLPSSDPVLAVAAGVEAGLGGEELSRWQQGPALPTPSPLPGSKARARSRRLRSALKPRVVVAVSGVDGAGKSTLARVLIEQLDRVAVPCAPVWTRPGMRIGWLEGVARRAKRILGEDPAPGVQTVARGERNPSLASRRGLVGMVWALLVTLSFSIDVRCRHLQTRGVVVYDRHLLDALVTLDFVYEGVDLRFHRRLLRAAIPGASVSFYVEVPAEVAIRRKRDELFGEHAVRRQLDLYERRRREIRDLHTLDGTRPPGDLAHAVLKVLLDEQ